MHACLLVLSWACASAAVPFGVDNWGASEIAEFFRVNASVSVPVERIQNAELTGQDLFDGLLDDAIIEKDLGIQSALKRKKIMLAIAALDAQISADPHDFWEWRAANLRLCDFWICPLLLNAPRALIFFLRFFNLGEETSKISGLEKADAILDDVPAWNFWLQLVFVPNYSIFRVALAHAQNVKSVLSFMLCFCALLRLVADAIAVANRLKDSREFIRTRSQESLLRALYMHAFRTELQLTGSAFLGYYIGWWLWMPRFLLNWSIYVQIGLAPVAALVALQSQMSVLQGVPDEQAEPERNIHWPPPIDIPDNLHNLREIPPEYKCPITMEIMREPGIVDGHTYEREAIVNSAQSQREQGLQVTNPKTNLPMNIENMVPNMALRSLIEQWVANQSEPARSLDRGTSTTGLNARTEESETRGRSASRSSEHTGARRRTATPGVPPID